MSVVTVEAGSSISSLISLTDKLTPEWYWVLCYGIGCVAVVVFNWLLICSVIKNAFLRTNTHRAFALLAFRNSIRALYSLVLVYATKWSHPTKGWKFSPVNSTKVKYNNNFPH